MRNLIYILLFITSITWSQNLVEIVAKGSYKATTLDSLISNYNTYRKALQSAENYLRLNKI